MGVFPAASRAHVPEPWGVLMTNPVSMIYLISFCGYQYEVHTDRQFTQVNWFSVGVMML